MDSIIMWGQLLTSLSLLVFIHELGHFLAAKAFGMKVDKFFIFFDAFGTKLWSKKIGETEYGIGWLPLGGYVKIAGMIDESMDTEQMEAEPQEWEFRSKPAWQRFIVMIGGIVMNILMGIIVFAYFLDYYEQDYVKPEDMTYGIYAHDMGKEYGFKTGDKILTIDGEKPNRFKDARSMAVLFGADFEVNRNGQTVKIDLPDTLFSRSKEPFIDIYRYEDVIVTEAPDSLTAYKAGIRKNDQILAINGQSFNNFYELKETLTANKSKTVFVTIDRNGQEMNFRADVNENGQLGFIPDLQEKESKKIKEINYSLGEAFSYGIKEGWEAIYYNAKGFGMIFTGKLNPVESVQSPIGIAKFYGPEWIWSKFWYLTGLISFVLAFMNILPIPALDGGHMMFIAIEVIRGRPLSDAALEKAQMVGMLILLPLMVFVLGKDIWFEFIKPFFDMVQFFPLF